MGPGTAGASSRKDAARVALVVSDATKQTELPGRTRARHHSIQQDAGPRRGFGGQCDLCPRWDRGRTAPAPVQAPLSLRVGNLGELRPLRCAGGATWTSGGPVLPRSRDLPDRLSALSAGAHRGGPLGARPGARHAGTSKTSWPGWPSTSTRPRSPSCSGSVGRRWPRS